MEESRFEKLALNRKLWEDKRIQDLVSKQKKLKTRYIGGKLKRKDFEVDLGIDIDDE